MWSRLRTSRDRVLNLRRLSRTLAVVFTCANASLQSPACTNREISMSTTITSLLNSLQSHLQSQTQLLPTLHTQLGLPPTALADDLSTLEKQLTECVESQVNARREQVDEWMDRCSEVENHCIRYGKALGNHVKATGSSVGEIRKEQVLPRRFDMITEYQEKLRQVRTQTTKDAAIDIHLTTYCSSIIQSLSNYSL